MATPNKSARPLSASLLAPKGGARPANGSATYVQPQTNTRAALFDVQQAPETPTPQSKPEASQANPKPDQSAAKKAAFTFRMSPQRHFRLRLLSAHQNRSSQRILEEALDAYLETHAPQSAGLACPCFDSGAQD